MSGHNKWSTIKHKKAKEDAKRGKVFTKLIKEITIAARMGGGDESANPRLRTAILAAKTENMPKDNITRAIKKGTGELEGVNYEEISYEGYGPEGVAMLIDVVTDNKNRTVSEVRHALTKYNGKMGATGSVSWLFATKGYVGIKAEGVEFDEVFEVALEAGADDIQMSDDLIEVYSAPENFVAVKEALEEKGYEIEQSELSKIPSTTVKLEGKPAETMLKLMDTLEDNDDVQNVWANFDIDDSILESFGQ